MSRRTSESNKAIAQAWEREKQRVSEGSGTRDWTPDQQRDILRRGKAYDENGKAFEGQHMRSAEMHPECQGDLDNIQFLTREEHLAAHDGDWRNPTNWYYNPVTKEKLDFGDGPIIPCDVIELTNPVNIPIVKETPLCDAEESSPSKEKVETTADTIPPKDIRGQMSENERKAPNVKPSVTPTHSSGFIGFVKRAAKATGSFISAHKAEIISDCIAIGGTVIKAVIDSSGGVSSNSVGSVSGSESFSSGYLSDSDDDYSASSDVDDCSADEREYSDERQSPREHDVSGYTRYWNGREIHVDPYKRGGKKDE